MNRLLTVLLLSYLPNIIHSQQILFNNNRIIPTGMPFLTLQSDARASSMADIGSVSSPDVFSQSWNPSKYTFMKTYQGIGISYTPYLNKLTNDVFLGNITYFFRTKEQGAWGFSFNYFNMGNVEYSQVQSGAFLSEGFVKPNELTLDISYSLKLSNFISTGVTMRWLHSNLQYDYTQEKQIANGVSISLSGYYQSDLKYYNKFDTQWKIGISIMNIGPKLSYEKGGSDFFIPTNLKVGTGYDFILEKGHSFSILLEANKLLVPTSPLYGFIDKNNDGKQNTDEITQILRGKNPNVSFFEGIFQSFTDAPNGLKEELQEISISTGIEYRFWDDFSFRCGYFYENRNKGGRNNLTFGAGFRYQNIKFHLSYLFSISEIPNPLENSVRMSGSYELFNF